MHLKSVALAAALLAGPLLSDAAASPAPAARARPAPIEVMFVGVFHMSNPGKDMHDVQVDDVLTPKRQAELAAIAAGLNRFHPTKVAVEWPADVVAQRYPKYLDGTLPPSRNEVVQMGFRLARLAGDKPVFGIDADGDFPYEPVKAWADSHGRGAELAKADEVIARQVAQENAILKAGTLGTALRSFNTPAAIAESQAFYAPLLSYGAGADQPGAELMAQWTKRNYLICAHLVQIARPGDRIVVIFGNGHAFLMKRCIADQPGMKLVEANAYLPAK